MNEQLTNLPHGSTVFTVFLLCIRYRAYCSRSKWTWNCSRSHLKHLNAAKLGGRASATQPTGVAAPPQKSHRAWAVRPLPTPSPIIPTFRYPPIPLSVHTVKGKDCGYEISKLCTSRYHNQHLCTAVIHQTYARKLTVYLRRITCRYKHG